MPSAYLNTILRLMRLYFIELCHWIKQAYDVSFCFSLICCCVYYACLYVVSYFGQSPTPKNAPASTLAQSEWAMDWSELSAEAVHQMTRIAICAERMSMKLHVLSVPSADLCFGPNHTLCSPSFSGLPPSIALTDSLRALRERLCMGIFRSANHGRYFSVCQHKLLLCCNFVIL